MKFGFFKSDQNWHDHSKAEAANWDSSVPLDTIHGPKIRALKLTRKSPGFSWRFIFYWPSGAWWALDVFSKMRS